MTQETDMEQQRETATIAGGCFWCTEAVFSELRGVDRVEPGYAGGRTDNPTYRAVCTGTTGHAEAARVTYDPSVVSYEDVLSVFFATHDPTQLNRQGGDIGTQYRSAVFYESPDQHARAERVVMGLKAERIFDMPIVTTLEPLGRFYTAEDYHRDYFARNPDQPYCAAVIAPKVAKFRRKFLDRLKKPAAVR
ncbi:MAG: peptide-methionine (S)-S-oxide reductase MsrA [Gemmatimonadaceae bacterium]